MREYRIGLSTVFTALAFVGVAAWIGYQFLERVVPQAVVAGLFLGTFVFAGLGFISALTYAALRRTWLYVAEAAACAVVFGALTTMY